MKSQLKEPLPLTKRQTPFLNTVRHRDDWRQLIGLRAGALGVPRPLAVGSPAVLNDSELKSMVSVACHKEEKKNPRSFLSVSHPF